MGRQTLVSHAVGKKRITLTNCSQALFQRRTTISNTKQSDVEHNSDADKPSYSKKVLEIAFKGELRQKLHPCFYGIFLLILWRKSLVQSFAVF